MAEILAQGVDVANHQMGLNAGDLARAGKTFMWAKVTEGIQYTDPWSDEHQAGAAAAGLAFGGYHFARPDTNRPQADAEWSAHVLTSRGLHKPGYLPPLFDIEDPREGFRLRDDNVVGANSVSGWCREYLRLLMEYTGRTDIVTYASTDFIANRLGGEGFLPHPDMRLLVAHYGRPAGQPGWMTARVIGHQYRSDGMVPGWPKGLDFDALFVPVASLLSGAPAPTPGGGTGGGVVPAPNGENRSGGDGLWWNLPPEEYYGDINGPRASHGGYYPAERDWVRRIQKALIRGGFARRNNGQPVTDPNGGWADGKYEQATVAAVKRFQAANSLIQTGNVWPDDWERLDLRASD